MHKSGVSHTPVCPFNYRANGKIESAVKMAKNIFWKAMEERADPFLAMLDHRNTLAKSLLSLAQKLMSRTKMLLPTREDLLKPEIPWNFQKAVKDNNKNSTLIRR